MKLVISETAAKSFGKMPRNDALALRRKLETFAADPYGAHGWAKALVGGGVRVRQGDWRAVCGIDGEALIVFVTQAGHRQGKLSMSEHDTITMSPAEYEAGVI